MELLVAILHAHQDADRLGLARRVDLDRLEAPLERAVLLDVLAVLGRRGRADAADLAATERRLQDVGGVERPFGRAGPDQRVQLVDEHDDVRVLGELLHDRLEALFELTAVLGAGDDQRDVEREQALVGQEVRHVAVDDLLRQPFDDRGLADAGLADEHGVVLGAAAQHLLHPLELVVAADQRIELVLHRRLGEVAAELGQQRRFLDPRQRRLLVEQLDDVLADRRAGACPSPSGWWRPRNALRAGCRAAGARCRCSCAAAGRLPRPRTAARAWSRALKGISTEVDTFSRNTVRPSISLRMFSRDRCDRAKMRLVSPLPSRISPSSRCSVSIEMLPSWLASYRAKNRTRRALSVYRSNIRPPSQGMESSRSYTAIIRESTPARRGADAAPLAHSSGSARIQSSRRTQSCRTPSDSSDSGPWVAPWPSTCASTT